MGLFDLEMAKPDMADGHREHMISTRGGVECTERVETVATGQLRSQFCKQFSVVFIQKPAVYIKADETRTQVLVWLTGQRALHLHR